MRRLHFSTGYEFYQIHNNRIVGGVGWGRMGARWAGVMRSWTSHLFHPATRLACSQRLADKLNIKSTTNQEARLEPRDLCKKVDKHKDQLRQAKNTGPSTFHPENHFRAFSHRGHSTCKFFFSFSLIVTRRGCVFFTAESDKRIQMTSRTFVSQEVVTRKFYNEN